MASHKDIRKRDIVMLIFQTKKLRLGKDKGLV